MDPVMPLSRATPPPAPLAMPVQDLAKAPRAKFRKQPLTTLLARLVSFVGALGLTIYAGHQMFLIISVSDVTRLQWLLLALFVITFGWIALAATSSLAGMLFGHPVRRAAKNAEPQGKTVLLMPVYNEDPAATCAALSAMVNARIARQLRVCFEFFFLPDATHLDVLVQAAAGVYLLRQELDGSIPVWYGRGYQNTARQAGNVHDFVMRWGGR